MIAPKPSTWMSQSTESIPVSGRRRSAFATTLWTKVVEAGAVGTEGARTALETLCQTYWYPLYAWTRRQGYDPADAEDLVQGFFQVFFEKGYLKAAGRSRGRFRSYLLSSLKHYISNRRDWAKARKRGGGYRFVPVPFGDAEARYGLEPADCCSADQVYDRRWALTVLEGALGRVRRACEEEGKAALFEELKGSLLGGSAHPSYAEVAAQLGMSEGAVKIAAHRLRQRYRAEIREEIAATVLSEAAVEAELKHLVEILRR